MEDIVTILVYSFWIGAICAMIYTAIDTPLRPVQNWSASWRDCFIYAFRHYWIALCVALVFLVAPSLDFFLSRFGGVGRNTLILVAVAWQLLAAGILAAIAVRIHYWAGQDVIERDHTPFEPNWRREIRAAAIGVGVLLVMLGSVVVLAVFLHLFPKSWLPIGDVLGDSVRALAFSVLSLIRPCLSLGARRPIRAAAIGFSRRPLGFFLWITALAVPALLVELATQSSAQASADALSFWGSRLALVSFQIFNYIAFEMTTLRMVQGLSFVPQERFELGFDESL